MVFLEGDVVVAPGCGIGHIADIESMKVGAESVEMYKIVIKSNGIQMWVPTSNAVADGIRRPIEIGAIDEVLAVIENTSAPPNRKNWNQRRRRYGELLMSNDPLQLAALVGELAAIKQTKTLSFGERRLFEQARELLHDELQIVCGDTVGERMESILAA